MTYVGTSLKIANGTFPVYTIHGIFLDSKKNSLYFCPLSFFRNADGRNDQSTRKARSPKGRYKKNNKKSP